MLELKDVCFAIQKDGEPINLVDRASLKIPRGHFMAIVGPSGCGKTTLLKTIAGLNPESDGSLWWNGRNLSEDGDLEPWEIGYVPTVLHRLRSTQRSTNPSKPPRDSALKPKERSRPRRTD